MKTKTEKNWPWWTIAAYVITFIGLWYLLFYFLAMIALMIAIVGEFVWGWGWPGKLVFSLAGGYTLYDFVKRTIKKISEGG